MTQEDQPERGLSSFASEIEDFKVMIQSSHLHYLALFDEFGKRSFFFSLLIIVPLLNVEWHYHGPFLNTYHNNILFTLFSPLIILLYRIVTKLILAKFSQ